MDAEQMAIVTRAIDRMLEQHEPHPACAGPALKRNLNQWSCVAIVRFICRSVMRSKPRNLLDLMLDRAGMRPFVEEWEKVAAGLLQRVRREAVGQVLDAELQELLKRLREFPGVAELKPLFAPQNPVLPIAFRRGHQRFSYFSLITTSVHRSALLRRNCA
jgi:hypothetical protein